MSHKLCIVVQPTKMFCLQNELLLLFLMNISLFMLKTHKHLTLFVTQWEHVRTSTVKTKSVNANACTERQGNKQQHYATWIPNKQLWKRDTEEVSGNLYFYVSYHVFNMVGFQQKHVEFNRPIIKLQMCTNMRVIFYRCTLGQNCMKILYRFFCTVYEPQIR